MDAGARDQTELVPPAGLTAHPGPVRNTRVLNPTRQVPGVVIVNNVLASTSFWLRGKREVYSGRVTFSDDEARLK